MHQFGAPHTDSPVLEFFGQEEARFSASHAVRLPDRGADCHGENVRQRRKTRGNRGPREGERIIVRTEKRDELIDVADIGQDAANRRFEIPPVHLGQTQVQHRQKRPGRRR
jgi:hypothetical protein